MLLPKLSTPRGMQIFDFRVFMFCMDLFVIGGQQTPAVLLHFIRQGVGHDR